MNIDVMYSKKTDNWRTPKYIYNYFMEEGYIDTFQYMTEENELKNNYYNKKLFINPPFSKMKEITEWIIKQRKYNNEIIILIPVRTDTKYMHKIFAESPQIYFIKGRLHYNESKSAPFPTMIVRLPKISEVYLPLIFQYGDFEKYKRLHKQGLN